MKKTIYILLALVMLFGGIQVKAAEEEIDPATILKSFNELYSYILYYYVDEPDIVDLLRGAMQGMVETLDVHSTYLSEEEFEDLQMEFEGHFGGIGIVILPDLTVVSPIKGTPGERVGIQPGDVIIAIDGESTEDMSQTEAVQKMRGEPGTTVRISIMREGEEKPLEFEIIREDIEIPYVEWEMKTDKIGYISIADFAVDVGQKVSIAIEELTAEGAEALILDLRTNPGGLLSEAINVASNFLAEGTIVSVRYRVGSDEIYEVNNDFKTNDLPLVVLINQGSASASEIVAAAIRDHGRGILMGMKSFGKGTVQTLFSLSEGSALKLTTGRYYTPLGDFIHEKGIEPDVEVGYDPDYEGDNQLEAAIQYIEDIYLGDVLKAAS
ncbi:MAG TPA: S41 family peptidase [Halanaerobiaceae bacterium]|nr:S41 family peptidase [Bacillota bacterium]HHU92717.1 S41 family peptidase [Halanaerobiaceae bacterium]HOA39826.1 S41 family peptidase [Halanaerobiales bacterium]HPZ62614.1 S41 family peptidase [Halanaerobiales bacterium]HQD03883.1 S41 family peptidase [Halanaerobiales bacterium]